MWKGLKFGPELSGSQKNGLLAPMYTKNDHFTETGSGQTGKAEKGRRETQKGDVVFSLRIHQLSVCASAALQKRGAERNASGADAIRAGRRHQRGTRGGGSSQMANGAGL